MYRNSLSVVLCLAACNLSADDIRVGPQRLKGTEVGVGRLIPDLQAVDINGDTVRLSDFRDRRALVIAITSTSCPLSRRYVPTLAKLEQAYRDKGVAFLFVDPIKSNSSEDAKAAIARHGLRGPYIRGSDEKLIHALAARTTTEVLVLDAARTLIYRGAIDDQYGLGYALEVPRHSYLVSALDALLAGSPIEVAATTAPGCELAVAASTKNATITYHNRVSRILQNHCVECHRQGGVAPFALDNFDAAVAHRGMIRKVVERGTMPPWFAAHSERHWANDRSLAAGDKTDLLAWLTAGHPVGDPKDAPLPRRFAGDWQIGTPDLVLQIPQPIQVEATGTMPYQHARVVTTLSEDRWIQAVEIRPTDRAVVHHVLVFVASKGAAGNIDERTGFFAAYVPGNSAQRYPEGFAKKLPAGATLVLQLHYTPNGTATSDQTRLGLVFAKQPPRHIVRNVGVANRRISIPAGADNHAEHATQAIPAEVQLLAFMPHMHLRGKAFRYDLVRPDGSKQNLLDVPHYDFNWQLEYRLAEPLSVPAGSRVEVTGWFDNSDKNPANPDPSRAVRWGPQTYDEMLLGYIEYFVPTEKIDTAEPPAAEQEGRGRAFVKELFKKADRNGDGKVTPDELPRQELFRRLDRNGDGLITLEEAEALLTLRRNE